MYGTQGIQQQGRQVSFGQEDSGSQSQYGQGKRKPKDQAAKERDRLRKIEVRRLDREGIRQRSTKEEPSWLSCAKCMVATGLSLSAAGRILRMHGTSVQRQFKSRGIAFERRSAGDHGYITARRKDEARQKEAEESQFKAYKEAAMKEIRQHRSKSVYPCWSVIWDVEKARRNSAKAYQEMPEEIKREKYLRQHNKRITDPEARQKKAEYMKEWSRNNPEKRRIAADKWRRDNPEKLRIYRRKQAKAMRANPKTRALMNLRSRLKEIMRDLRQQIKGKRKLIGCTIEQFTAHIEGQFHRGMCWDNYGTRWHIDHIVPCSKFDHTIPSHVRQCWHYTNLQPLWAEDNLAKSDTVHMDTQLFLTI